MGKLTEYAKLLTFHQWGVSCLTAVFGALSTGMFNFFTLGIIAIIGVLATVFGAVFNDYMDVEVDKQSEDLKDRPLVKGSIPSINALYITILVTILAYTIIFVGMYSKIFLFSYKSILALSLAAIFATIYNIYGKKFAGSDILVGLAAALYCLFGALLVSESIGFLTIIIVLIVFIQIFYMNSVIGGLKDADHDYKTNTKNIAYALGVKVKNKDFFIPITFKIFGLSLRLSSAILIFLPFFYLQNFPYEIWQPIIIVIMYIGILYASLKLLSLKIFDRDNIRRLISIQTFLRYIVVPIMLFSFLGYKIALFLILFPFVWYAIFNRIIYGSLLKPKRM